MQEDHIMMTLQDKVILVTGGTGSFGQKFIEIALRECNPEDAH